ncbi:RagB/SusD family nutrient uptake outer membrane protein [Pedobacter heparinus]|uniref:RagB/SusD domain protein n=1 Tax=Pedobacter heparinus (strain ATCC 13125 / DSM 2366 / CIP 104194 / JCM 7457 / NBRC 12017 / NCIMB 9290 / NRRL B-14731 / HIM 762-3) TaxID=485917 RepID=C6Y1R2_PEDHD|nr:RagB/SusD family nutrient uptake outer membrane protein [Pedobacter heparinus]ACU05054.1 RagB/SusD domain protein [Pedobacter heparinus DSM 2366]
MKRQRYTQTTKGFLLICSLIFLISCKKMVEIELPNDRLNTITVFADSANATQAILGLYIKMLQNGGGNPDFWGGGITLNGGLSADELVPTALNSELGQFYVNSISVNNGTNDSFLWKSAYYLLYHANACIEGVTKSTSLDEKLKNKLVAEAKFIRALGYFYLLNMYGDVPLVISTDFKGNAILPRTQHQQIYTQIISDLKDAQRDLPASYMTNGRFRPNRYAATALMARVYLFQKEWAKAEEAASELIDNSIYQLEPDLNAVFLIGSKEAILQVMSNTTSIIEIPEAYVFIPGGGSGSPEGLLPSYVISSDLLNTFEAGDSRKNNWLASSIVNNQTYYYPYKYKRGLISSNSSPKEGYMVLRLAEQYLIRAEARAQLNNISGAISDLNEIRKRAGLTNTSANDQESILAAVSIERRLEFFCEWGARWLDLKRTEQIDPVMRVVTPQKGGGIWNASHQLFPIPFSQIQVNPYLIQNPGYN